MDPASAFSFDMSYCGQPPTPDQLWSRWNADPALLLILVLSAVLGAVALRQAGPGRRLAFGAAWLLAVILFVSPFCSLTVALLSARVGHHALLATVLAPLLALSLGVTRRSRPGLPFPLFLSTLVLWFWHIPPIYAQTFAHPALYWVMQLSLLGSFTLLWQALLSGTAPLAAGMTALLSAIQMGLLGALLTFAPQPLYLPHFGTTPAFGLGPLEDQQLAGLIMWVPANLPLMALVLWRLAGALQPTRQAMSR